MTTKKLIRWVWEFPQCLLGFILTKIYNVSYVETYKGIDIYSGVFPGAISLGLYILMSNRSGNSTKRHEYGHTIQSRRWGWFYLPVVGLTSITWCGLHRFFKIKRDYYSVWPENKATEYGNIK